MRKAWRLQFCSTAEKATVLTVNTLWQSPGLSQVGAVPLFCLLFILFHLIRIFLYYYKGPKVLEVVITVLI